MYVNQLMKLGIVEEGNASKLHNFLDTVASHVQALSNQGINKKHFGAILISVFQKRIPHNVRLEISQKMGKDNWKLEQFLKLFRIEKQPEIPQEIKTRRIIDLRNVESNRWKI